MTGGILTWPGLANVRDLGGLPTGEGALTVAGRLVRADDVGLAGPPAWEAAVAHGVRRIVDLRFPDERERRGSPTAIEVVPVSVLGERDPAYWDLLRAERARIGETAYVRLSYTSFLDTHPVPFAEAVRAVASAPDGAVLVHCVAGKDRTGILVGLLLRLADVPLDAVDADYALSEALLARAGTVAVDDRGLRRALVSPAGVLRDVLGALEERHGSVAAYLRAAGSSDAELDAVRRRLVDP